MNKEEIQEVIYLIAERKILLATRILTNIYKELESNEKEVKKNGMEN